MYGLKLFFFFVKSFDFGKRMTLFGRYFNRNGVEQSLYLKSVSFCLNNVIKLSCMRKVDVKINIK